MDERAMMAGGIYVREPDEEFVARVQQVPDRAAAWAAIRDRSWASGGAGFGPIR